MNSLPSPREAYNALVLDFDESVLTDPPSNTGSQTSKDEKNPNNGSENVVAKLDWVQGVVSLSESRYRELIRILKETFLIELSDDLGPKQNGRKYGHHHKADGSLIAYDVVDVPRDFEGKNRDDEKPECKHRYDVFVSVTGRGLANCQNPSQQHWQWLSYLDSIGFKATRLDIAVDDFGKKHHPNVFIDATESGEAYGYRRYSITSGKKCVPEKGWIDAGCTLYLGSRQSDKMYRYYDKSVESKGITDSYRLELEAHDEFAQSAFSALVQAKEPQSYYQALVDIAFGGIDYRSKAVDQDGQDMTDDLGRVLLVRSDWWQSFIDRAKASPYKIPCGRVRSKIEQSVQWVERSVSRTLATIQGFFKHSQQLFGESATTFDDWLKAVIDDGRTRVKSEHIAQIFSGLMQLSVTPLAVQLTETELVNGVF